MNDSSDDVSLTDWRALHADFFSGSRCLVTGGAGFIGSHLTGALVSLGAEVSVLDDLSGGNVENLAACGANRPLSFLRGDIRDAAAVEKAMAGCRFVFHLAAMGSVPRSITMPAVYADVNIGGTMVVLEAARESGVERLVFASSSSVYGETPTLPKHEDMPMLALSPYAAGKI